MKSSRFLALLLIATLAASVPLLAADESAATAPATKPAAKPCEIVDRTVAAGGTVVVRLDNGLPVIVKAVRNAPVVHVRAYVRAGSLYEREFLGTGISHLLEHLVAKGEVEHDGAAGPAAPKIKPKAAPGSRDRVTDIGGQSNASTSLDRTQYYIEAAASKADDCIELIADWMARPLITKEDFEREHGVVQRELELGKDDPRRVMWETHGNDVFGTHPAAAPVIGFASPLHDLEYKDVLTYHSRMYGPANMAFVVVGDVDVEKSLATVCKAFAGFNRGRAPELSLPEVEPLAGVRRTVRAMPNMKEVMQEMSFQTIPLLHEDLHALDALSTVLSGGESSRLIRKLHRELKLVTSVDTSSWTPEWGKGLFTASLRAEPGKADAAEKALLDELHAVAEKGVTAEELARAKRQMVAQYVYSQQSVDRIAATLGSDYLSTGDVDFSRSYTQKVQAVTVEQVNAAARKYLTFDRMAITRLTPKSASAAVAAAVAAATKAKPEVFTLPNGLRVVLKPTDAVQLVSMTLAARGGVLLEDANTNGLGSLMAALSTKGAAKRSAEDIATFFANAGGGIGGSCGNNTTYWTATVLDDSFATALEIFSDVVLRPTLDKKELDLLRPLHLAAIDRIDEHWMSQLQSFFRGKFYTNSPYRFDIVGRKQVVSSATGEQLAAWHKRNVRAGDSVLAICGNFDVAAAKKAVERLFADMPAGKVELTIPAPRQVPPAGEKYELKTDKQVGAVMIGAAGMKLDDEDRFALNVLDTIISGWQLPSGWLHTELRGKQLVYVVHAQNWAGLAPGAFIAYAAGQPEKIPQVIEIIHRNLRKAAEYKPTQEEVNTAVNTILTAELLDNQSMNELAMAAALDELYGFGYDFRSKLEEKYRKVTPEAVAAVGRKYLSGGYVTCVEMPEAAAAPAPKADK